MFYHLKNTILQSITLLLITTICTSKCGAQIITVEGTEFFVADSTTVMISGHAKTVNSGIVSNAGRLIVNGDFQNNGLVDGANTNTGIFVIKGDWINNGLFEADESTVIMDAMNTQWITGNIPSVFHRLYLANNRKIITQNTFASYLELDDYVHLETGENIFSVINPDVNALTTDGNSFVSSTGDGRLKRVTKSTGTYHFPVGAIYPVERKMFVDISPDNPASNEYGVRFVNNSPDEDGYMRNKTSGMISSVNDLFYHHIYHSYGNTPADIYFHVTEETEISEAIGHWEEERWIVEPRTSYNTNPLTDVNVYDFTSRAFAFIKLKSNIYVPNAFSPNGDNINDTFYIVPDDKKKIEAFQLTVHNRWGEPVFETTDPGFHWQGGKTHHPEPEVFVWQMTYKLEDGTAEFQQGTITLIK